MNIHPFARWILQGFVIFTFLILVVLLTSLAINFRYRRKAERLLQDVQSLRVGQSTTADVLRIMSSNGGGPGQSSSSSCTPKDGAYDVWTGSQSIERLEQSVPVLRRFGLRQWATAATVILREGRVCYVRYGVDMMDHSGEWEWVIDTKLLPAGQLSVSGTEYSAYRIGTKDFKGMRMLRSELAPGATEEKRRRAFTYDFSCVTSFRGCRQRCEISPLVWQDVYQDSLQASWKLPIEETSDPRCAFAEKVQ